MEWPDPARVHTLTFEHCYLMIFNLVTKWTEGILPHEDVLKIPPGKSKAERVRLFAKRPHKKGFIDQRLLKIELRNITHDYGRSNLCLVVDEIITKGKLFQK